MKKNVFIISAPLDASQPEFHYGVKNDRRNLRNYFISGMGGGFFSHDVHVMENPTWEEVSRTILLNPADYSVVVFSGHGHTGVPSEQTKLSINSSQTPTVNDIITLVRATKLLFIIDACRTFLPDPESYFSAIGDPDDGLMDFSSDLDALSARNAMDNYLYRANDGIELIYSCSPGQESEATKYGSVFTMAMLNSIRAWSCQKDISSVLLAQGANEYTRMNLRAQKAAQMPQIKRIGTASFPLAFKQPITVPERRKIWLLR